MTDFLHGVKVIESQSGNRPIRTVRSSVIGIVGTAPTALDASFPLNTPVLISSRSEAAALRGPVALPLAPPSPNVDYGTLPDAVDGILDQAGALVVVIRVDKGADAAATLANIIGGTNSGTGNYEGVHALLGAESTLGVRPRILCAPGFTDQKAALTELESIAERLRAVVIADAPGTTDAAAIAYAKDFDSRRIFLVSPEVAVFREQQLHTPESAGIKHEPVSSRVAGLIAKSDNDRGFWWSPSNQPISGISGVARPIDYTHGEANSRANVLNENKVATVIRHNGYRLWGNLTLASDQKWQFFSVVRTADIINDSILDAHLWAVDRPITKSYLDDVAEGVNSYLAHLTNLGAILGGRCWPDPDLNSVDQIAQGKVYFNFDFTPPYPAQTVHFISILTGDYIEILNS